MSACTRKKERLIATNANNFTSEHIESDQHEGAMADWRTVFPTLTDKKYLFIVLGIFPEKTTDVNPPVRLQSADFTAYA